MGERSMKLKTIYLPIIILALTIVTLRSPLTAFAEDRYSELQTFTKVLNMVQQFYVEEVDTKKLIYGAIKGMLRELDPHTNYMPTEIYKEFESETSGEFGGLGIEISIQNGILTIISPIEDAPAWNAGVKAGDKIVAINGHSTKGLSLVEASQYMRGKRGSVVTLSIVRGSAEQPTDYAIRRGQVKLKSIKYTDLGDGYAYIRITSFIENSYKDLETVLSDHSKKNKDFKGLLIDLRRNPGGLFEQAIKISDLFLDEGIIVSTIGRNKQDKEIVSAKKDGSYPNLPLVILINEYSASASEILAGALQDNNRAIIAGERSFGKGSVQSVIKLGDGSGLKLTVARYYTPSGRSIQAEGIVPDIEIQNVDFQAFNKAVVTSDNLREKDMEGHLASEKPKINGNETKENSAATWWNEVNQRSEDTLTPKDKLLKSDFQVFQAFNYLKTWKILNKKGQAQ
jgi:carboxyl-terminal processing protease